MKTNRVTITIADYCSAFDRNEIVIDKTYQRSPNVWPNLARGYLIETILKDFPVPKLALHQVTDLKSKRTIKYVVDGQQRTMAIRDFFADELRLGRSIELAETAGRTYSELPPELQEAFLSYVLVFDQFEAATDEHVREYFRRINSFTAPLNAEEQRHARFQGPMKWFIYSLAQRWGEAFVNLGVLPRKSVIRMADAKLLAEIVHALIYGISTTSKATLNSMYQRFDKGEALENEAPLRSAIDDAITTILSWTKIHETALMRMNVFYSLMLAIIAVKHKWPTLPPLDEESGSGSLKVGPAAMPNLLTLAAALEDPEAYDAYEAFTQAAEEKTNVKSQRETRVRWLVQALVGGPI
jgi:hypothetical protein